jgi:hypothetical protein
MSRTGLGGCAIGLVVIVAAYPACIPTNPADSEAASDANDVLQFWQVNPFNPGESVALRAQPSSATPPQADEDFALLFPQDDQLDGWVEVRLTDDAAKVEDFERRIGAVRLSVGTLVSVLSSNAVTTAVVVADGPHRGQRGVVASATVNRNERLKQWKKDTGR